MEKLACSVVIVSYYTKEALAECLNALLNEQNDYLAVEIIVVDNGNSEKNKAYLKALAGKDKIQWVRGQGNVGFAKGCNLGVHQATTDNIMLLNPDCIVKSGALNKLLNFSLVEREKNPNTVVSGWIVNPDGSEQRGLRRNLLTPWSLFVEMLPFVNRFQLIAKQRLNLTGLPTSEKVIKVGACSGACMMMSKSLYDNLNGMNEAYFLHVDDLDFCRRLHNQLGQVLIDTGAIFSHYQGTSTASQQRVDRYKRDGFMRYFATHHPLFWYSPLGLGLRLAIQLNYLRSSK